MIVLIVKLTFRKKQLNCSLSLSRLFWMGCSIEFWELPCLNKNWVTIIIMFNICGVLTMCRYCSKCCSCINSVILYNNPIRSVPILCPFYVWGHWGREWLSNLSKVIWLISVRTRIKMRLLDCCSFIRVSSTQQNVDSMILSAFTPRQLPDRDHPRI